ncbi:hypothetical protein NM688_g8011 [Phlebia brevispora]|uniref:Uncharacterized protein n=1 Tax=Phlebia brevispora TaxID=194682 RepID=A0ACC1RYK7_9APHY|nr:hypothetical protein NM688_g8011 [Phlebia brevispora]
MPRTYSALSDPPHSPSSTDSLLDAPSDKSIRVKYRGAGPNIPHDLSIEYGHRPIDVSLVLPHFRARNQPLDHRLSMSVGNASADAIKVKICRNFTTARSTKFHLEVYSSSADITIWLPSDFKGHIHRSSHCKRVGFSAGFRNRIMQNVHLTQSRRPSVVSAFQSSSQYDDHQYTDIYVSDHIPQDEDKWFSITGATDEDEVVVHTAGTVTFRMWDIDRGEPETKCKEACRRMFSWCMKRSPEVTIDWDFLLDD